MLFHDGNRELNMPAFSPDVAPHLLACENGDNVPTLRFHLANWRLYPRVENELPASGRGAEPVEELSELSFG
jgi:hypothetical protein